MGSRGATMGSRGRTLSVTEAVALIPDGATVAVGGFVAVAVPEGLLAELERRFLADGAPRDLTLVFAAGVGDRDRRGLNHLAHPGLVRRAIGAHWGLAPALADLVTAERIEGYCFPQGVMSQLYRDIAAHRPGVITRVGLGTFADPRVDGGKLNQLAVDDLVRLVRFGDEEYLFYPAFPVDVALIRATSADPDGNLSLEREALTTEVLALAQAVHNSGGTVIAQVERVVERHDLPAQMVRVPGVLVDVVVVAGPADHPQTFAEPFNPAYLGAVAHLDGAGAARRSVVPVPAAGVAAGPVAGPVAGRPLDARTVIARRAARELRDGAVVNLGIGVPEGVAVAAAATGVLDRVTLTVEPGAFGGVPAGGLSFGASAGAVSIIDQPAMFDFYDGGGLDQAFLGFAEIDARGDVNVSRFGGRLVGAGGFVNISQNAREVYFLGTFAARSRERIGDGRVAVEHPGDHPKFVARVGHVTFSAEQARRRGATVHYVTERCVLRLGGEGLELVELAPGVDLERDVLAQLPFRPKLSPDLTIMDADLFREVPGRPASALP